jgi:lysophospholipase L1-like esterase
MSRLAATLLVAVLAFGASCTSTPSGPTSARWGSDQPQLACPPAFAVTGVVTGRQAVTFPLPTAVGTTALESVSCTPASGTTLPVGPTTVTCTGTDRLGRTARCGFVITLEPLVLGLDSVVAFGDSVTAGENALPGAGHILFVDVVNAYPTKLQTKLDIEFPVQGIEVANEGLSGERATDGVARLPTVLAARRPDALLLLDGYNDLLGDGLAASTPVADALRDMVRLSKADGVPYVFVATLTPSRPGMREIPTEVILQTNFLIAQMADAEGAVLVDLFDAFFGQETTLVGDDGLHLTPAGNDVVAETFFAAIKATVPSMATLTSGEVRPGDRLGGLRIHPGSPDAPGLQRPGHAPGLPVRASLRWARRGASS